MLRRLIPAIAFALGLTGCTVPAATGQLLDVALAGLDQAVANQKAAQAAAAAGLDAQQDALASAVEFDLRGNATDDKVSLADALALLKAHHQQSQALALARMRHENDARMARDNLAATRELVDQARRLVLVSSTLDAHIARLAALVRASSRTAKENP
jgi:hypothetical protein